MHESVAPADGVAGPEASTLGSLWRAVSGAELSDELLEWPPDVFALTDVVLERCEAYRFAVSPPREHRWPPSGARVWNEAITVASRAWSDVVGTGASAVPELVATAWSALCSGVATSLDDLASGQAWRLCEALLTLHALADEACAGTGVAVPGGGAGLRFRGRARERLTRTGSLSRVSRRRLRVLPRVRNAAGGISFRSIARYLCVRGPSVDVVWNRVPLRRPPGGGAVPAVNVTLLPWPLEVRETDFRPIGPVLRTEQEPFGFFEFAPGAPLDLGLVDRTLAAARARSGSAQVVVFPESAIEAADLERLEPVLAHHRVMVLVAGIREAPDPASGLGGNWLHLGVRFGGHWWHYRQNKHHRWFLDERQIEQYHLSGTLAPAVRWWEAMEVPRRVVQFLELGGGVTLVFLICEDLARLDEVADLLRAVGPTLVVTVLLDGPQLPSRWTARYASVFADDPGSSVVTLTSFGFVQRCRPAGRPPSSVVSLWKDAVRGFREIPLEPGSQGVVANVSVGHTTRRSADGRFPVANAAELVIGDVTAVRAAAPPDDRGATTGGPGPAARAVVPPPLDTAELTILTSWAEVVAEALAQAPDRIGGVLDDARPGSVWRQAAGLEPPSAELAAALGELAELVAEPAGAAHPTLETVRANIAEAERRANQGPAGVRRIVREALRAALEWQPQAG